MKKKKKISNRNKTISNQKKDISNKTVLTMLVVVILVSVASLWVYLDALSDVSTPTVKTSSQAQGVASIQIKDSQPAKLIVDTDAANGVASIKIQKP
ncbi:MAG: hypothetical protein KKA62_03215 [Nanoarchaeota archaeon]|nr:hypothetical protein [Nanoarchaeota archaeon]MBU1643739.1 hypothetical protein [Nanoarchaeota archaeon]MBU1976935.1 hypothetical protein [Nanoarchaeota archaeon]